MKRRKTSRSPAGQQALEDFRAAYTRCWFCGVRWFDVHHIVHRRGTRFDDRRNFAAACRCCHDRIHGSTVVWNGKRLPPIPQDEVLAMKRRMDAAHWDEEFLESLK